MRKFMVTMLVLASISTIGCKDTVVLEQDVNENGSVEEIKKETEIIEDFEVTEIPLDIKETLFPITYVDNKVIATYYNDYYEEKMVYSISEDGEVSREDKEKLVFRNGNTGTLWSECFGVIKREEKDSKVMTKQCYYVDNLKGIDFKLEGYNDLTIKYANDFMDGYLLPGNEKYYVMYFSKYSGGYYSQTYSKISEQQVIIIDTESKKMYHKDVENTKDSDNFIASLYYDNNKDSIMAVTYSGKIKKVNINENSIEFEDYKSINLQGYGIRIESGFIRNAGGLKNKVVIPLTNYRIEDKIICGIYDTILDEFIVLEEDLNIHNVIGKNNLVNLIYKDEAYLAQIKEDNTVNFLYKFSKENYNCTRAYGVINEGGDTIFISKWIDKEEENGKDLILEHSFLKLNKK